MDTSILRKSILAALQRRTASRRQIEEEKICPGFNSDSCDSDSSENNSCVSNDENENKSQTDSEMDFTLNSCVSCEDLTNSEDLENEKVDDSEGEETVKQ